MSARETILVTGGTGFLGRRLGIALRDSFNVVLAARNNKQNQTAAERTGCRVLPMDVSNIESVRDVFTETRPALVIHAAATKFVDLAEQLPMECIDVNVVGSQNVARVAVEKSVRGVIGISTDKAAPPIRNTYGLSKALMERMFSSMNGKTETKFACVRYGNVAWSTGSVLPIWKKMHDENGIVRSTGPEMRRFFFTVDEAVTLVRIAIEQLDTIQGRVLARPMKAAQIQDLLKVWVENKGGRWERMNGRPGERLDEYLVGDLELPYAREVTYDGARHIVISFNEKSNSPLPAVISSANAERLTHDEMVRLINHPED